MPKAMRQSTLAKRAPQRARRCLNYAGESPQAQVRFGLQVSSFEMESAQISVFTLD